MVPSTDLLGDVIQPKLGIGYAGTPGLGPSGETCKSCVFSRWHGRASRRYYKCHHELAYRSFSIATDIKLKTPACQYWSKEGV